MCLEMFMLSSAKTQSFSLILFEVKMGQKTHVGVLGFFPEAGVAPTHRARSAGGTRTVAHSHKSFSHSYAVFAAVEGGLSGPGRC